MSKLTRSRDDEGAYAILYALLVIVLVGVTALVIDISTLREDRRQNRSAADAAAVAAASSLDTSRGTANPQKACNDAWSYLVTDLPATAPADNKCTRFPTTFTTCPTTPVSYPAVSANPNFNIVITWPVPDNSTLLTAPDIRPADATVAQQNVDTSVDGTDPCSRIGVQISLSRTPFLAGGAFGVGATTTQVTSVARGISKPGPADVIAALNVLEQNDCQAILTSGQGFVDVKAVGDHPGIIAVESAGHESGSSCPNNHPYVIDEAKVGNSQASIFADGPLGPGQGQILAYAMNAAPVGNIPQAYTPVGPTLLSPTPTVLSDRVQGRPITNIYDCKPSRGCTDSPTQYLTNLQTAFGGSGTPQPYAASPVPYGTAAFKTLPGDPAVPTFKCKDNPQDRTFVPAGNWYINCTKLTVSGQLVIAGGNVVTAGGIDLGGGCFAMNVPLSDASSCPTVQDTGTAAATTVPSPQTESILYMRSGDFTKGAQAALFMPRTFTYLANGIIDFGAGSGTLLWTNPIHNASEPTTCVDAACENSRFGKLALWSESTRTHQLGGQTTLGLRGIMFTPKATFSYSGATTQSQTSSQFWALKLNVGGQSGLVMAPDPTDSVPRPLSSALLIR